MDNPTKGRPPLKIVNGTVCVKTKLGWRDIKGMCVTFLKYVDDKPRFLYGRIKHVIENRIQITIPTYRPGQDDKFINTTLDDSRWSFSNQEAPAAPSIPRTTPLNVGTRCDRARPAIHPQTHLTILLRCVMRGPHGTCHYENPSDGNENV